MSETIVVALITLIGGLIGGGVVTAAINAYLGRRKSEVDLRRAGAEASAVESATRQSEVAYFQKRVESYIAQMDSLEKTVANLKVYIGEIQIKYEQRVGELHTKIDLLSTQLERANRNLDTANETIVQLRQEVKDGLSTITELRKEITQLLVDQAGKSKDDLHTG